MRTPDALESLCSYLLCHPEIALKRALKYCDKREMIAAEIVVSYVSNANPSWTALGRVLCGDNPINVQPSKRCRHVFSKLRPSQPPCTFVVRRLASARKCCATQASSTPHAAPRKEMSECVVHERVRVHTAGTVTVRESANHQPCMRLHAVRCTSPHAVGCGKHCVPMLVGTTTMVQVVVTDTHLEQQCEPCESIPAQNQAHV